MLSELFNLIRGSQPSKSSALALNSAAPAAAPVMHDGGSPLYNALAFGGKRLQPPPEEVIPGVGEGLQQDPNNPAVKKLQQLFPVRKDA